MLYLYHRSHQKLSLFEASVNEDNTLILTQEELLVNATDIDGGTLTASNVKGENVTVTVNDDGDFLVTPIGNFSGDINLSSINQ
jgi:hypothetical protein